MSASRPIVTAPNVVPFAQVAVGDADVDVGQARYDAAHYDVYPEATYSGLEALFEDVSCTTIEARTFYGRERAYESFDIGTATLTVANDDGFWDYPAADADTTVLTVRPGRQIRVGVRIDGATPVWLWRGWIDATRPEYRPGVGDVVTVDCVDAKGEAGRVEIPKALTPDGEGETATLRVWRIAERTEFPTHRRQLDETGITLKATQFGARASALFDQAADSSGGVVHGDDNGFLVYRQRDWLSWPTGTPPDVTIGNRSGDQVCPNSWEISFARADFTTRVVWARTGEEPRTLDDVANKARFGVETYTQTNLDTIDETTLNNLATRWMAARNFARAPRIAAVTLDAAHPGHPAAMAAMSPFTPTLVSAGLIEDDGRTVFTRMLYVTGVEHTITAESWTARIALDDAFPFLQASDARYDSAHYNQDYYAHAV